MEIYKYFTASEYIPYISGLLFTKVVHFSMLWNRTRNITFDKYSTAKLLLLFQFNLI